MKFGLWLVKLYWLWIVLGAVILIPSVIPPGISILGLALGGALLLWGLVAKKAMSSDSLRSRIERNL